MSVIADSLLTQVTDTRAKTQPQRPEKQPQGRENTEFSDLYARERASSSIEPKPAAQRAEAPEKSSAAQKTPSKAANEPTPDEPAVADTGKELPPEDEQPPEADSQTLQWLGLEDVEQPVVTAPVDLAATGLAVPMPVMDMTSQSPLSLSLGLSKTSGAVGEIELDVDKPVLEGEQVLADELVLENSEQVDAEPSQSFDKLFALKPLVEEVSSAVIRGAGAVEAEAVTEVRGDNALNRLSALAPVVTGQTLAAKALPLVPGQAVPMQQEGWSDAVVDRVMWLSSQNLKSAEIQLDPAELGRLEVRISLNQESTQITFSSLNAGVRDALESQMHRLRELFAQQGMNQLDVNVSDQSLQRGQQDLGQQTAGKGGSGADDLAVDGHGEGVSSGALPIREGLGLVDYYA